MKINLPSTRLEANDALLLSIKADLLTTIRNTKEESQNQFKILADKLDVVIKSNNDIKVLLQHLSEIMSSERKAPRSDKPEMGTSTRQAITQSMVRPISNKVDCNDIVSRISCKHANGLKVLQSLFARKTSFSSLDDFTFELKKSWKAFEKPAALISNKLINEFCEQAWKALQNTAPKPQQSFTVQLDKKAESINSWAKDLNCESETIRDLVAQVRDNRSDYVVDGKLTKPVIDAIYDGLKLIRVSSKVGSDFLTWLVQVSK